MKISSFFRFGSALLVSSLFFASAINANGIASENQEAWLKSIQEAWAEEDSEFKNSPTSPLAGTSRFEISETGTVFFAENEGQLGWSLERGDQPVFSLARNGNQWEWTGQSADIGLYREDEEMPSGSALSAGDSTKAGRFTAQFYPSAESITVLVFDPQEGDEVLIDFNLVTNPLCSYATIYNCIVPTTENRLRLAIEAGVKKYH